MGFIVRNMSTRKRIQDVQVSITSGGQQFQRQIDQDSEFFIRSGESSSFFRRQNVTVTISRYGAQIYQSTFKYPVRSRWYTINLK